MATSTRKPRMFTFQCVSRLFMVELANIPFDQRKIVAIVIRMTPAARLTDSGRNLVKRMQPLSRGDALGDRSVAVEAGKNRLPRGNLVALNTVGGPAQ